MIHQLVYYSRNLIPGDGRLMLAGLREILAVSQKNNAQNDVTGFLIFDKKWFIQVLEGDKIQVRETYDRIAKDTRHTESTIVGVSDVAARSFTDWSMGGSMRSVEAQEIYLAHGVGATLDPRRLPRSAIMMLAGDLQAYEKSKRDGVRKAG